MDKIWAEEVKGKLDSFNKRKDEISKFLDILQGELKIAYDNIEFVAYLSNLQELIRTVSVDDQMFYITEEEVANGQEIQTVDENNNIIIKDDEKREVKETIQDIILHKLKTF